MIAIGLAERRVTSEIYIAAKNIAFSVIVVAVLTKLVAPLTAETVLDRIQVLSLVIALLIGANYGLDKLFPRLSNIGDPLNTNCDRFSLQIIMALSITIFTISYFWVGQIVMRGIAVINLVAAVAFDAYVIGKVRIWYKQARENGTDDSVSAG